MIDPTLLADVHAAAKKVTWAYLATTRGDQPKLRIVHPIWEDATVWIATGRSSAKARQLDRNPKVELFYQVDPAEFVHLTVTGRGHFVDDAAEKRRLWSLFDYDLGQFWKDAGDPAYGLLRVDPTRIELTSLPGMMSGTPPRVWRRAPR